MADVETIEIIEKALSDKRNEVLALENALSVLKGDNINAVAIAGLPRTREFEHVGITEAAKQYLKEVGSADTRTIADTLLDRGLRTRSKNMIATVYATLNNGTRTFKRNKKDGVWTLVEEKD